MVLAAMSVLGLATTLHAEESEGPDKAVLLDPEHQSWSRQAPDTFRVKFATNKGDVVLEVNRVWAPLGADRFYNLVDNGFYDGCKFFRVIRGAPQDFMAQFGVNGDPEVSKVWREQRMQDDPVVGKDQGNMKQRTHDELE